MIGYRSHEIEDETRTLMFDMTPEAHCVFIDNTKDNFTAEIYAQANDQLIDTTTNSILMTENTPFSARCNASSTL